MHDDKTIRQEAWRLLWKRGWFWKLLGATILLQVCAQTAVSILDTIVCKIGVFNLTALQEHFAKHQEMPEFTSRMVTDLASSSVFCLAFALLMGGIVAYGTAAVQLRAADDDDSAWMNAAFSGFRIPFDCVWLMTRMAMVYMVWSLLAALPMAAIFIALAPAAEAMADGGDFALGALAVTLAALIFATILCIPFYKYRYLFRIKAENPEMTAGECMKRCRELTGGRKWRIFKHDCSYWKILLLPILPLVFIMAVAIVMGEETLPTPVLALGLLACLGAYMIAIAAGVVTVQYIAVGQTILYRDISRERTAS